MAKKKTDFQVNIQEPGKVKGVPVLKLKSQFCKDLEDAEITRLVHQSNKELFIEVIDHKNKVKTLYTKTLREKNYTISTSKIIE